ALHRWQEATNNANRVVPRPLHHHPSPPNSLFQQQTPQTRRRPHSRAAQGRESSIHPLQLTCHAEKWLRRLQQALRKATEQRHTLRRGALRTTREIPGTGPGLPPHRTL
ncbi:uncharacterized protein Tco025E_08577, partial [Trypanosoma conorhini]